MREWLAIVRDEFAVTVGRGLGVIGLAVLGALVGVGLFLLLGPLVSDFYSSQF